MGEVTSLLIEKKVGHKQLFSPAPATIHNNDILLEPPKSHWPSNFQ